MPDNTFNAEYFPMPAGNLLLHEHSAHDKSSAANFVGVCFSGGGSRALSATMGQLRGLKYLDVLKDVFFISTVSGGTWATSLYTFLPPQYDEDDFLGRVVVNPHDLTLFNWHPSHPEYALDYLPPHNLGSIPPTLGIFKDLSALRNLKDHYHYPNNALWQGLIGTRVLSPWGLWNPDDNGFPNEYYSLSKAYLNFNGGILDHNKQLSANQFYVEQRRRPFHVMNSSIVSDPLDAGAQLLPFESTPVAAGVRHTFEGIGPGGRDIGGGLLQPFAMGGTWLKDLSDRFASVTQPARPFSLSDMVCISSAAFAEMIQKDFPEFDGIIPKYPYWPVYQRDAAKNSVYDYQFADGGSLEDTGITALLNRNLPNIIAFVNGMTPLKKDDHGEIVIDPQIQLLFGKQPTAASLQFKEFHRKDVPNNDVNFCQVFDTGDYDELAQGLWAANAPPNNSTAMYLQTLTVKPNANFGIAGNYPVRVLWIYNTWVKAWHDLLHEDVKLFVDAVPHFPNYDTVLQLDLDVREVNLLAQLSCWNVINDKNAGQIKKLFYDIQH